MSVITGIPAFRDNYFWFICDNPIPKCTYCAIVDPGDSAVVTAWLTQHAITPVAIFITHHHHDHIDGIVELKQRYSLPVYGPEMEPIPGITHRLRDGYRIVLPHDLGNWAIMTVPGHTRGHIAYWNGQDLFCGDTLFGAGCGRLFEGTPTQMYESLNKIAALPTSTSIYCAHEYTLVNLAFARVVEPNNPAIDERIVKTQRERNQGLPSIPTRLQDELATNPFLRCNVDSVRQAAEQHQGQSLISPEATFAVLRSWRDHFRQPGT